MARCYLVLEDGAVFDGLSFGAAPLRADDLPVGGADRGVGEVVFNTGMCGYHEMLTDPSCSGQVVVLTSPHAGNYGCSDEWSERGPDDSGLPEVKLAGFVVRSCYFGPLPPGRRTLDAYLRQHGVPGVWDADTRAITTHLRERGSCNGVVVRPSDGERLSEADRAAVAAFFDSVPPMEGRNLLPTVGTRQTTVLSSNGAPRFVVVDCGVKRTILRELTLRGTALTLMPWSASAEDILSAAPDGVLVSNGPGDPAVLTSVVDTIGELLGRLPVFGICLGHQIIAHALGGGTRKMKFGHHGCNHPVRDERTGRVQVTSQNHGFEVAEERLPPDVAVWFRNANDGSVEGLRHRHLPVLSCQFHPEAAPGPRDSSWIFDEFVASAKAFADERRGA